MKFFHWLLANEIHRQRNPVSRVMYETFVSIPRPRNFATLSAAIRSPLLISVPSQLTHLRSNDDNNSSETDGIWNGHARDSDRRALILIEGYHGNLKIEYRHVLRPDGIISEMPFGFWDRWIVHVCWYSYRADNLPEVFSPRVIITRERLLCIETDTAGDTLCNSLFLFFSIVRSRARARDIASNIR